mmetsp:Transcript_6651/g.11455  ORF Transcript_6651/g.11455 Transcript_6651/m.11455 type:complete len:250 (+) Transcript_6651:68-817(+)|eukprot:CAMPEP_0196664110 /NCGR_PEP_ID=MMETSP1086-20130531/55719_1 /TAXON_ID=77921 /ORGANISM="Cyanoptyche  gloeocystis , Strain SAG4.97" /LENGTH=249 /DNA_ID=CAMNT_0042000257 /DNA_START=64 /DNA_END=813 /DNA_ORIENTATION=+
MGAHASKGSKKGSKKGKPVPAAGPSGEAGAPEAVTAAAAVPTPAGVPKVLVLFYSTYGHMYQMAKAAAEGAKAAGAVVTIKRVPETLTPEILGKMGALEAQKQFESVPVATVQELPEYDAIIFGIPTRFGNPAGQMKNFLDATGQLWFTGALVGKIGSVMSSTSSLHGGAEMTIVLSQVVLQHHGMVVVGLPYAFQGQMRTDEPTGGSPYGATTHTGPMGARMPSANELDGAKYQGSHVAKIAAKLIRA